MRSLLLIYDVFKYNVAYTDGIIHLENNHRKINTFEEIEILKADFSKCLLNDAIAGQNDPI